MSIVSKILGRTKKQKPNPEPTKHYNNPKVDGTYRICFHCKNMFQISDDKSRAALCWPCYLRVLRSGHYLSNHLTAPEFETYPDSAPITVTGVSKPNQKKCVTCGKKFLPKSNRQVRCEKCGKKNAITAGNKRVRKHRANRGSSETV